MDVVLLLMANSAHWRRAVGAVAAIAATLSACASDDAATGDPAARVGDVNWAFSEVAELETKVGSLEAENRTLRRRLAELQERLQTERTAREAATEAAEQAAAEIVQRQAVADASAPAAPVITAPDPGFDLPDGPTPVQDAPRLVQPSFASADMVFENEAPASEIPLQSVLWGVHLDSFSRERFAREGWGRLQRTFPDELGLLEPRTEKVTIEGRGEVFRLIGGGFASEATARALCAALARKSQYCRVVAFSGERLSIAEAK